MGGLSGAHMCRCVWLCGCSYLDSLLPAISSTHCS
jgi:hypothetical protein